MKTHDLTERYWGHDYVFYPEDGGQRGKITMWFPNRVDQGDYLIIKNGEHTTRYQVETVLERYSDPSDMLSLAVVFSPR